jgi:RNA polymerase sigma factor (sigma-70 family)
LYAAYLQDPEKWQQALLAQVHGVAMKAFRDDDKAQEFAIMTWRRLPTINDEPKALAGWIWTRLQWRRRDYMRASQWLVDHEVQVPDMVDDDGDPLSAEESLDLLMSEATHDVFTGLRRGLDGISDPLARRVAQDLRAGFTQDEIALRLGINPSTLRSRLSRYRMRAR